MPAGHPLRQIRALVRAVLKDLGPSFGKLYASEGRRYTSEGRPSIPPEQLLSALLLQTFYGVRSERQLMEQLDYNLLYRWFVGLASDDPVWDATTFTKNRARLQRGDVFRKFMTHSQVKPLLSDDHFSVDGTLIEAWAPQKSSKGSCRDPAGHRCHTACGAEPKPDQDRQAATKRDRWPHHTPCRLSPVQQSNHRFFRRPGVDRLSCALAQSA